MIRTNAESDVTAKDFGICETVSSSIDYKVIRRGLNCGVVQD